MMDPLNGAADIETRTLRLVSNYGFLEEPALMIRAVRYRARLGWELDPRTQMRYENAKGEGVIEFLSAHERSRELEQIGHEDDGLKVLHALEAEGWMKFLNPQWTPAKADEEKLKALHNLAVDLLMQGIHADVSAAQMQLLTAKLAPKDLSALKKQLLRPGFVEEWNSLDSLAAGFQKVLLAKENQVPSASFKLFTSYDPEAVLWLGFTSKDSAVKDRYQKFLKEWPEVRQRIPYALMQEMRIKPELANYNEIVHAIFLELIDGKLTTPEEMRAFLEPYSPPAPPPQVTIKRQRGKRGEARVKDFEEEEEESEDGEESEDEMDEDGGDEDEIGLGGMVLPKVDLGADEDEGEESEGESREEEESEEEEEEAEEAPAKRGPKGSKKAERREPVSTAEKNHPKAHAAKHEEEIKAHAKAAPEAHPVPVKAAPGAQAAPAKAKAPAHGPAKVEVKKPAPSVKKVAESHPHKAEPHPHKGTKAAPAKHEAKHDVKHEAKKAPVKHAAKAPVKAHGGHAAHAKHTTPSKAHKATKPAAKKPVGKKH